MSKHPTNPSDEEQNKALLELAATKAARRPFFMASALATFQAGKSLNRAKLATHLGLSELDLTRLSLCRRPDPVNLSTFRQDVLAISQEFGLAPALLSNLLRQVAAMEEQANHPTQTPFLMAARDYEDDLATDEGAADD